MLGEMPKWCLTCCNESMGTEDGVNLVKIAMSYCGYLLFPLLSWDAVILLKPPDPTQSKGNHPGRDGALGVEKRPATFATTSMTSM